LGHDGGRLNTTPSSTSSRLHRLESKRFERGLTAANRRVEHMGYTGNTRRREGMKKRVTVVGAAAAVGLALLLLYSTLSFSSGSASAAAFPKIVSGHVYDNGANPVVGATVVVQIWDGTTLRYTEPSVTTNEEGFYTVSVGGSYWDPGNTIKVNATVVPFYVTNSAIADSGPAQTIDVQFTEVIPEFSSMLVVVVSMVALFVLMSARKKSQNPRGGH
jgi:hypothetical protein